MCCCRCCVGKPFSTALLRPCSLPHLDPLGLKSLDDLGANGVGGGNGLGPGLGPGQSVSGFSLASDSYTEPAFHGACRLSGEGGPCLRARAIRVCRPSH